MWVQFYDAHPLAEHCLKYCHDMLAFSLSVGRYWKWKWPRSISLLHSIISDSHKKMPLWLSVVEMVDDTRLATCLIWSIASRFKAGGIERSKNKPDVQFSLVNITARRRRNVTIAENDDQQVAIVGGAYMIMSCRLPKRRVLWLADGAGRRGTICCPRSSALVVGVCLLLQSRRRTRHSLHAIYKKKHIRS